MDVTRCINKRRKKVFEKLECIGCWSAAELVSPSPKTFAKSKQREEDDGDMFGL